MALNKMGNLAALSLAFIFAACGGDSGSNVDSSEKVEIVSSIDELGACTEKKEGDTVFVREKKTDFVCLNGEWEDVDSLDEKLNDEKKSSSSINLSSSVGNNDAKSSDSRSDSSVSTRDSSVYNTLPTVLIKDKSISGVSQKGPFVKGSSVTMQELDGETLAQTGKSFKGKISSDKGDFSVSNISLVSQYAILEATGYYRNEVNGSKSKGTITLNALTDLSDRKKVNINLLTHLEYERALYLVGTGFNVPAAKKQAEAEILAAFEINGDFVSSEDLEIFGEEDGNAALLAFSILMLGNRGEADLTELLTNFATDIETDGVWNDSATKTKIADWAASEDLSEGLSAIRSNIETWKLGVVPDFEKYIRKFWYFVYGLGECSDNRENEVAAVQNKFSVKFDSKERYICKNGAWTIASDIEKDTYQWLDSLKESKDGDVRQGDVEKSNCYVFENKMWRSGNESDCSLGLRGCTAVRQDTVGKANDDGWYYCDALKWREATVIEKNTAGWKKTYSEGDAVYGNVDTNDCFVYENGNWRFGDKYDCSLGLRGCIMQRIDSVVLGIDQEWYICDSVFLSEDSLGSKWRLASNVEKNTSGWPAGEFEGDVRNGRIDTDSVYVYEKGKWRQGMVLDSLLEKACIASSIGDTSITKYDNLYYVCTNKWDWSGSNLSIFERIEFVNSGRINHWTPAPVLYNDTYEYRNECGEGGLYANGNLIEGRINREKKYVCDQYQYYSRGYYFREATNLEIQLTSACTFYRDDVVIDKEEEYNNYYNYLYICNEGNWKIQYYRNIDKYGTVQDSRNNKVYRTVNIGDQTWMAENLQYFASASMDEVCPEGWRFPSQADYMTLFDFVGDRTKLCLESPGYDPTGFGASLNDTLRTSDTYYSTGVVFVKDEHYQAETIWLNSAENYPIRCIKD